MNQLKVIIAKLKLFQTLRHPKENGQSLIILTFAFLGLVAMLGIALDVGLVYIERVRLKRTVDAATLGAVPELPVEEAAVAKAISFLDNNGYPVTDINVYVAGCVQDIRNQYKTGAANYGILQSDGSTSDMINLPIGNINSMLVTANDVLTPSTTLFYPYIINGPAGSIPTFYIDTRSFQSRDELTGLCSVGEQVGANATDFGSANKIRVYGQVPVRMSFMQFFGFGAVTVADSSIAENASNLDVVLVLDTTGSMDFDTICYGCWSRCGDTFDNSPLIPSRATDPVSGCDAAEKYKTYPSNGRTFPFPYPPRTGTLTSRQTRMKNLIIGNDGNGSVWPPTPGNPDPEAGRDYIIEEAEFYAANNSIWDPALRPVGAGYWAIQRMTVADDTGGSDNSQALAIDGYGYEGTTGNQLNGMVRFHPLSENSDTGMPFGKHYTQAEADAGTSPYVEYDFMPGWGSSTYIHFKAQYYNGDNNTGTKNEFFWALYNTQTGAKVFPASGTRRTTGGAQNDHWTWEPARTWNWISENVGVLTPGVKYTLRIYAGSGGYAFDRLIFTSRSDVTSIRNEPATLGSAQRLAADPCNPIFGLVVSPPDCRSMSIAGPVDNLDDPLYSARNPLRGAMQAMNNFIMRLDPKLDQVGFVDFDNDAGQRAQLECLRASRNRKSGTGAPANPNNNYPFNPANGYPSYDEYECADPTRAYAGTVPISYTVVMRSIEDVYPPDGGTDIADGLRRGLHMLGITTDNDGQQANNCVWRWNNSWWEIRNADGTGGTKQPADNRTSNPSGHCGRGAAATSVIILLTDGAPTNTDPGDNTECKAWGQTAGNLAPYDSFDMTDDKLECIMYYTDFAVDNGVIIYTIGLGAGADPTLLGTVASQTNGQYYFAPSAYQLNVIFDQILSNVYVRLIQ